MAVEALWRQVHWPHAFCLDAQARDGLDEPILLWILPGGLGQYVPEGEWKPVSEQSRSDENDGCGHVNGVPMRMP